MNKRTSSLAPPFVFTAILGGGVALAAPGPKLPASRAVDPIELRADGSCWQAKVACAPEGCDAKAKVARVRCPPPAPEAGEALYPRPPSADGVCYAMVKVNCPRNDCVPAPDHPCPPMPTCNPPPPMPVPCPGEGDASQIHKAGEPPPARPVPPAVPPAKPDHHIERNEDGSCTRYPVIPPDFRCDEGATCNPPAPYQVPCPPDDVAPIKP